MSSSMPPPSKRCPHCAPECPGCQNVTDMDAHIEWHGSIVSGLATLAKRNARST